MLRRRNTMQCFVKSNVLSSDNYSSFETQLLAESNKNDLTVGHQVMSELTSPKECGYYLICQVLQLCECSTIPS